MFFGSCRERTRQLRTSNGCFRLGSARSCKLRVSKLNCGHATGLKESLQDLYRDISRLIQLAHPGERDKLVKYIGVESFIRTLDDRYLRLEILKLKPANLEEAARHAIRLEALVDSVDDKTTDSSDQGGGRSSARSRTVFAVADNKPEKHSDTDLLKRIKQLEKELKQAHKGSRDSSSKKASPKRSGGRNSAGRGDSASASGMGPVQAQTPAHACCVRN